MPQTRAMELPPRARRIRYVQPESMLPTGTTSACAENTQHPRTFTPKTRNYLRVRGEYNWGSSAAWVVKELPPRARRIRGVNPARRIIRGTTSACAENTH